jgi:hypothetical protein
MMLGQRVLTGSADREAALGYGHRKGAPAATGPGRAKDARRNAFVTVEVGRRACGILDAAIVVDNRPSARSRVLRHCQPDHPVEGGLGAAGVDQQERWSLSLVHDYWDSLL